jgi:hypothetical protein
MGGIDGNSYHLIQGCSNCKMFVHKGLCDVDNFLRDLSEENAHWNYEYSVNPAGICNNYDSNGDVELYDNWIKSITKKEIK